MILFLKQIHCRGSRCFVTTSYVVQDGEVFVKPKKQIILLRVRCGRARISATLAETAAILHNKLLAFAMHRVLTITTVIC